MRRIPGSIQAMQEPLQRPQALVAYEHVFRSSHTTLLAKIRRAGAWMKAFALLEDTPVAAPAHPHRSGLVAPARDRRPGVVAEAPHACVSPIGGARAGTHASNAERAAQRAARH